MFRNRITASILAACALAIMTPAAFASDSTSVTVTGGTLTITNPLAADFPGVTLNGADQTKTASLATFAVEDARGSGAGWNVTAQATRFSEVDGTGALVTGGKQLPVSSLAMSQPTVAADGTTSAAPSITAGPYTIDGGSAVKVASAAIDTGMGRYDFGATTLSLTVPANAYAKSYKSEVTITAASAP
jgi:hypothetical protein